MMGITQGALNTAGFGNSVYYGQLPPHTHISYQGAFNELRYNVGAKTDKTMDIHHGYSRFQFAQSKFDNTIHDYLALFLKGKADGEPRDSDRRLNSVICLDISGSMNAGLGSANTKHQSRNSLCIEAIKMFISKLHPEDSVGMTTFDQQAHLIFEPVLKKDIDQGVYERLDQIKACGGNTLIDGFNLSKELILKQKTTQTPGKSYQNRIIILSDVCDSSITQGLQQIKDAAFKEDVHLTIVGISTDFNSATCEDLRETKGFNYFCATSEDDILKYLFETFDYTFFPSASEIEIQLESSDVTSIEVFGTPDEIKSLPFEEEGPTTTGNMLTVTRMQSCFPSEIEIDKNEVFTVGGLVLVKIIRKGKGSSFKGRLHLSYKDPVGQSFKQDYDLSYEFHPEEQFLSDQLLRQAMVGFVYVSELKTILKNCKGIENAKIYQTYYQMLCKLEELCPKKKQQQYKNIKKTIENYKPKEIEQQKSEVKIKEEQVPLESAK